MKTSSRVRIQLQVQNSVFAVLLVAAALLATYLTRDSKLQWDMTQNQRNTLSQGTRDVLKKMQGPVTIIAYATPQDPTLGDIRRLIHEFVQPYQRIKPDLALKFIDPREAPKETAAANVRSNGELVIEYGKRSEHLTNLNEQEMANLLMRLIRSRERVIMYLDGHGEPKLDGQANFDLGGFGQQLVNKGFSVSGLNLTLAQEVPDNVAVLVIAPPRADLLKGEVDKIRRYLDRGGALLWLIDQEPLHGLQPIAEHLGLQLTPGTLVDPTAADLGVTPTIALSASYGMHAITENFTFNTAFPFARQIEADPDGKVWRSTPLVEAAARGWLETGSLEGKLAFDEDREVRGPVTVAVVLERGIENKTQRVVVVGSSNFLSNAYVGLLSNLDLGVNLLNWLSTDENLITIQPRARVDSALAMNAPTALVLLLVFLVVLPLTFLATGGMIWWRRRKA